MSHWPVPHHGMVSEYQSSGVPFVTSSANSEVSTSPIGVSFPFVSRWIMITNTGGSALRFGFSSNGVSSVSSANYYILSGGQTTERLELKCDKVFFRQHNGPTSFSLIAGLTNVPINQFFAVTGSNGVTGVG